MGLLSEALRGCVAGQDDVTDARNTFDDTLSVPKNGGLMGVPKYD